MKDGLPGAKRLAGNIVFIYAFFSSVWILGSDHVLVLLTYNSARLTQLQTLKGWIFVLITSALLYTLVRWGVSSLQASYTLLQAIIQGTTDASFLKNMEGRYR